MGDRHRASLFRIVYEISLNVVGGILSDNLYRVLVRPHCAVRAQTVKDRPEDVVALDRKGRIEIETRAREIVANANRETILRRRLRKIVEDGFDHRRGEFLGRQAVASTDDFWPKRGLVKRVHTIQIQRFSPAARLLGAIEDGDRLGGLRKGLANALRVERPIEPHFEHTNPLPEAVQEIDRLASRFAA